LFWLDVREIGENVNIALKAKQKSMPKKEETTAANCYFKFFPIITSYTASGNYNIKPYPKGTNCVLTSVFTDMTSSNLHTTIHKVKTTLKNN